MNFVALINLETCVVTFVLLTVKSDEGHLVLKKVEIFVHKPLGQFQKDCNDAKIHYFA